VDFYSWLNVPSTANLDQLNKAYRKKTMVLQYVTVVTLTIVFKNIPLHILIQALICSPDKNRGVKNIEERFARLGVIGTILRNPESRKRYDFFYKNGVPKWRGTGYYYARFRPGVGVSHNHLSHAPITNL
jgi:DnaJ family protein C protein 1